MTTNDLAVTERGNQLPKHTEADVELGLRLLVLSGNDTSKTCAALHEEGIHTKQSDLRYWRDVAFPTRYTEIRRELAADVGEEVAGKAMERAIQYDAAETKLIEATVTKLDEIEPNRLAASALAMARAK